MRRALETHQWIDIREVEQVIKGLAAFKHLIVLRGYFDFGWEEESQGGPRGEA